MKTGTLAAGFVALVLALSTASARVPDASVPRWIEANHAWLRYDMAGRGADTLVLLHEIGMSMESWNELMPALTTRYRVLRYDLRGFGLSEKMHGPASLDDAVGDLQQLLDGLHVAGRVTLIGGAFGASVAIKFAADYPARVKAVAAISPVLSIGAPANNARGDMAALMEREGIRAYLEPQLEALYPAALRTDPERFARFMGIQLGGDPQSRAAVMRMSASADFSAILPQVHCPVLVVATALFPGRRIEDVRAIADALPGGEFLLLQTGHLAALESPELLAPPLLRFLAQPRH
jgi:3-oxoadipate enol-lactonase